MATKKIPKRPPPLTLGQRMKAARRVAGLRQQDVAAACDVGLMTVSCWERDLNVPRSRYALRIGGALNAPEITTLIFAANAAREKAA